MKHMAMIFIWLTIFLTLFTNYLLNSITTIERSRIVDVSNELQTIATSIAHDQLTLGIDDKYRKENVLVLKQFETSQVETGIKTEIKAYVDTQPNMRVNNIIVKANAGSYSDIGKRLTQTESQMPYVTIEFDGVYFNAGAIINYNSNNDEIPIKFKVSTKLDTLYVNQEDERDKKTIAGDDFKNYLNGNSGSNFYSDGVRVS